VLDIGSGTGFFSFLAAYMVAPTGKVLGIEVSTGSSCSLPGGNTTQCAGSWQ
jgi:predicted RNA methylase